MGGGCPIHQEPLCHPTSKLPVPLKGLSPPAPRAHVQKRPVPLQLQDHRALVLTALSLPQWRAFLPGLKFEVIGSAHISLYTDESSLKMDHVAHVPQSPASHVGGHLPQEEPRADMLRPDPRDTFFLTPRVEPSSLENVLEPCAYAPTYVVKDFPIARYQGLQFVYLSFVYPNDHTRLTHMETENKCFYRESPLYLERFGFYKYMKMDREEGEEDEEEEVQRRAFLFLNPDDFLDDEEEGELLDSLEPTEASPLQSRHHLPLPAAPTAPGATPAPPVPPSPGDLPTTRRSRALSWAARAARPLPLFLGRALRPRAAAQQQPPKVYVTRVRPGLRAPLGPRGPPWPPFPGVFLRPRPLPRVQLRAPPRPPRSRGRRTGGSPSAELRPPARAQATQGSLEGQPRLLGLPAPTAAANLSSEAQPVTSFLSLSQVSRAQLPAAGDEEEADDDDGARGEDEDSEEAAGAPRGRWREDAIDWQRTFSVGAVDFEQLRSDWNDLRCNVSGNLQLPEAEAVDVVAQYMERLNARHGGCVQSVRVGGEALGSVCLGRGSPGLCGTFRPSPGFNRVLVWAWHTDLLGNSCLSLSLPCLLGLLSVQGPCSVLEASPPHRHPGWAPLS
uniref:N-acetyl-beta-glucosaminyl-glycoprotein 4-beta-N-acetylgalactosaminyltransferase 1-like n=1 Tax=Panthera onca TaxID=9690 RepID=UPI0029538468|nr:N-acetyl-beta-glucosaminyl-glycoprotein 4-beta-N-acetylgalactosaminyltransferase 1-like [Panthera onca]